MSWTLVLEVLAQELGAPAAAQIEARLIAEVGGLRVTVPKRAKLPPPEAIEAIAPGRPREAARQLEVHPTTVYRALQRARLIR